MVYFIEAQGMGLLKGTFKVRMAEGDIYTIRCPACGHENGTFIDAPEHPVAGEKLRPCIRCKRPDAPWVLVVPYDQSRN